MCESPACKRLGPTLNSGMSKSPACSPTEQCDLATVKDGQFGYSKRSESVVLNGVNYPVLK